MTHPTGSASIILNCCGSRDAQTTPHPDADTVIATAMTSPDAPIPGAVITVSTRCVAGTREDLSGPLARTLLSHHGVDVPEVILVPDDIDTVRTAIADAIAGGARVILTTGGTGVTPDDFTPEATAPLLHARFEGLETQVRAQGLEHTPLAGLSRGLIGVTGRGADAALIINTPGSRGGVKDAIAVMGPLIPHIINQLGGCDH